MPTIHAAILYTSALHATLMIIIAYYPVRARHFRTVCRASIQSNFVVRIAYSGSLLFGTQHVLSILIQL